MSLARNASSGRRVERLEARVTANQKRLLKQAAEVQGRTLTEFVVGSLVDAATRVLRERDLVVLSAKDRELFVRALLNPPALDGGRLARAVERYRRAAK